MMGDEYGPTPLPFLSDAFRRVPCFRSSFRCGDRALRRVGWPRPLHQVARIVGSERGRPGALVLGEVRWRGTNVLQPSGDGMESDAGGYVRVRIMTRPLFLQARAAVSRAAKPPVSVAHFNRMQSGRLRWNLNAAPLPGTKVQPVRTTSSARSNTFFQKQRDA